MQFINLKEQYLLIEDNILEGIRKVLEHGQYIMGPEIQILERELAKFIGVRHAIVNSSGTDALLLALLALDIQPGDEVITTPFSFFATAEVIMLCHAKPVFVDIDPDTYNLDPSKLEASITSKTKAIMPVSLYGQCADMKEINQIANSHGLPVIEDAAQSFGASYQDRQSCGLSTIGCTSFFPSKPLGGYGDSGACFTDDDDLALKLFELRNHGQNERYKHKRVGINGRMDTIQAAILLEKLKIFPNEIKLRDAVASRYNELLPPQVRTPIIRADRKCIYAQYTIEVDNRTVFQQALQDKDIPTAVHYPLPLHEQEALKHFNYAKGDFPHSERASERVVSLPMHPYLSADDQDKIVEAVYDALNIDKR